MKFPVLLCALAACAALVSANVPAVEVSAPYEVAAGQQFSVAVTVSHPNPSASHYVDEIILYNGDTPIAEYSYTEAQPSADFREEFVFTAYQTTLLTAKAHCTTHGWGASEMQPIAVAGEGGVIDIGATPPPPPPATPPPAAWTPTPARLETPTPAGGARETPAAPPQTPAPQQQAGGMGAYAAIAAIILVIAAAAGYFFLSRKK